jgi:hypothetical protein
MTAKDLIRQALKSSQNMLQMYLSDLSDADLLVRPVPTANHIAWQLGHLVNSEVRMLTKYIPGGAPPELPAGFAEQHDKQNAASQETKGFGTKQSYLDNFNRVRATSLEALNKLPDADLDKPIEGDMARMAPTVGAMYLLMANHAMMHFGQFTVVRRKLGKPVLF